MKFISILLLAIAANAWAAGGVFTTNFFATNWWRNGAVLDLDFAQNRYYLNGTSYSSLASFLTASSGSFTRASSATYFDSNGVLQSAANDVARFNYDSSTKEPKGILVEEASSNLLLYSSDFSQSQWSKQAALTVTSAAATAPDGTFTATLFNASGTGLSYVAQAVSPSVASSTVTRSVFVKPGTTNTMLFEFNDSTNCANYCVATFNLATKVGTWDSNRAGVTGALTVATLANGWLRVSATLTYSAAGNSGYLIYVGGYGSGIGSLYLWGAQLEKKAFVTSYMPTGAATASRSADSFYIPTTGWFDATKGTFLSLAYGQANSQTSAGYGRVVGGDFPIAFTGFRNIGGLGCESWNNTTSNGISSGTITYPTLSMFQAVKMAFSWDDSTMSETVSANAAKNSKTYAGSWATTKIYPGGSNYTPSNAEISRITYFPSQLPDAYLQAMTR